MPLFFPPFLLGLLVLGGMFFLGARLIRALEHRPGDPRELQTLHERMARLEEALEMTNARLERLSESQEFTTRLLEGRKEQQPGG